MTVGFFDRINRIYIREPLKISKNDTSKAIKRDDVE
jgi:hypothetical protein